MNGAPSRGAFITLEGGEGAGKSTQIRCLAEWLRAKGHEVVVTREPGGSAGAERIRNLLLDTDAPSYDPLTQALLFAAARQDHLVSTIRPALARGAFVLCDRFMDSTRAYQGAGGALETHVIRQLEGLTVGETRPDLTLILDLEPVIGMARARHRHGASLDSSDPFERETLEFHTRVRAEFLKIADAEPTRCAIIDANRQPETVASEITSTAQLRLVRFLQGIAQ